MKNKIKTITPLDGLVILILLASVVSFSMLVLELSTRLTLLLAITFYSAVSLVYGHSAKKIENYIVDGIKKSAFVVVILMVIGCVIGSWVAGGIIPAIIYYGLEVLTPSLFILGGFVSCSLVSYFTGSSFASMGTIGVALMGIGQGFGIPVALSAGLILSGSMFGDKMSPFSDTTNLASASANVPLFAHIRSMTYTTIPAWLISAGLYFYFGAKYSDQTIDIVKIETIQQSIQDHFTITPVLLFIPLITIVLAARKVPPIMAMSFGALLGISVALVFQNNFDVQTILNSLMAGLNYDFGSAEANKLFANRGGLTSMLFAVTIAMMALVLGEMLTRTGLLVALLKGLEKIVVNTGSLVICTILSCLGITMLSASQYLSIVMPGAALQPLYKKRGVSRRVLSRSLEDGGTMFSVLIPWTSDAAFVVATLGVATLTYLPYAFFLLISPVISIIFAFVGYAVWPDTDDEEM
ncbi:MAG: Na+/H+ antiporter NhaC [Robiginitomaculum sp.]|nr:Na+/H+ antiporter NhaC [Robiginitomaculum sp.]